MESESLAMHSVRPCAACAAVEPVPIHRQRFKRFDDGKGLAGYLVVSCAVCGFVYADDLPEQAEFDQYYRELSKYESHESGGEVAPWAAAIHRSIVTEIASRRPSRQARILDVGAASGHLLSQFRAAGFENVAGFDPSPRCSELARERYGLRVINDPISKIALDGERFDLILLASVLEHLRDVDDAIRGLRGLLAPGGAIWFEVPDAARFERHVHSPFHQFSSEHINFFTRNTLARMMRRHGFCAVDSWETTRFIGSMPDPGIDGLFWLEDGIAPAPDDRAGVEAVRRYVDASKTLERELCARLEPLMASGAEVIVWGTGSLTMHLLTLEALRPLRVRCFVDANRNYQGKSIDGVPVVAPEAIAHRSETILVVSHASEADIVADIRTKYRLRNETFCLVRGTVETARDPEPVRRS